MPVHLYGVTWSDSSPPSGLPGRGDAEVRLVSGDRVGVLVSDVDADRPVGRQDLLAHARVLEAYVETATVIPMQFGVEMPDDDVVHEEVVRPDEEATLGLLGLFDGTVQVTVHGIHHEEPALREVLRRDPRLLEIRDQLRAVPGAASEAGQVELGQRVADALEELEEEDRWVLLDRLAPLARAVAESEADGLHEVVNAAFLVDRDRRDVFDEAVGELREAVEERVRVRYVGPQPPYSFVEPARSGELAWD